MQWLVPTARQMGYVSLSWKNISHRLTVNQSGVLAAVKKVSNKRLGRPLKKSWYHWGRLWRMMATRASIMHTHLSAKHGGDVALCSQPQTSDKLSILRDPHLHPKCLITLSASYFNNLTRILSAFFPCIFKVQNDTVSVTHCSAQITAFTHRCDKNHFSMNHCCQFLTLHSTVTNVCRIIPRFQEIAG